MHCIYFVYAALAIRPAEQIFSQKSENFGSITFLPTTYKNMTKNPKTLSKSEKM